MTQQVIGVGTAANDGTGDLLRNAFIKANANFTEVYSRFQSVLDYMSAAQVASVLSGGGMDVTAAVQAAVATGKNIRFPAGGYIISDTITISTGGQVLQGECTRWNDNTIIGMGGAVNKPLFKATINCKIDGFSFIGSATGSTTNQHAIYINNANSVTVSNCFFVLAYSGVFIDGTSFYITIQDNIFYATYGYQLYINSASSAGIDLFVRGNRFLGPLTGTGTACARFTGLGSLLMSDNQFSGNNPTTACIFFDTPASLFGGVQAINNVFENGGSTTGPAVYIKGTSGVPWNNMYFENCFFTGGLGYAIQIDFGTMLQVGGGAISSTNAGGSVNINTSSGVVLDLRMNSVHFDGSAGVTPIKGASGALVNVTLIAPVWGGSSSLLDLSALTASNIGRCEVIGGEPGSTANTINLPSSGIVPILFGFNGNIRSNTASWSKPNTQTGSTYTVAVSDSTIIANSAGTLTLTLPSASTYPGRLLMVKTYAAQAVSSASSNVVGPTGGAASTAIVTNTAGKWALLESDATNWITVANN